MATYKQIQNYIKENYHISVKSCWIAHVKEINGLNPKKSPNRKSAATRCHPCPNNKVSLIASAMRHFNMIK
jgi:hypothetical protein